MTVDCNISQILSSIYQCQIYTEDEWHLYTSHFDLSDEISTQKIHCNATDSNQLISRICYHQKDPAQDKSLFVSKKIISESQLKEISEEFSLGVVSGCFDLLHLGHLEYLTLAREWMNEKTSKGKLCVLLLSDSSIIKKKGECRPIFNINERLQLLSFVKAVDYVVVLFRPNCLSILENIHPRVFFKNSADLKQAIVINEINLLKQHGGQCIVFEPPSPHEKQFSTTNIINDIEKRF